MNQHDLGRFCTESLESAAKRYKTLGFSIIPLHGARNPQQPKLPAIKWARFQHTYPTDQELHQWFAGQDGAGIGIVCGRVSRLLVLDFDDAAVVSEFRQLHPDLLETFTVLSGTRSLPHLYFRLPEGMLVQTRAYPGADLRGEGSYVVAPPTRVGEAAWVVESDVQMRALSSLDLRRILRFLVALKARPVEIDPFNELSSEDVQVSEFRHPVHSEEIVALYRRLVCNGRNQALFKTALTARDSGLTGDETCLLLADVHAREPGKDKETYESRYAEAVRTIASAYARPRRQLRNQSPTALSNAVREGLLQQGLMPLARVLDGLYAAGMDGGQAFTEAEACQLLMQFKIGRRSVMVALKAVVGNKLVFDIAKSPLNPPVYANAANGSDDLNNSCEMSRGAKRIKNGLRGRPARLYRLPLPDDVADMMGVEASGSDGIPSADFCSPRAYRQALHERLLERRPGSYPREWLAQRLGVSRWTTRRYEAAAQIKVEPSFAAQPLSWGLASALPEDHGEKTFGVFIQTSDGKRFPALRGLALRLIKQGKTPILKHQQANRYAAQGAGVGIPTPQQARQVFPTAQGFPVIPSSYVRGQSIPVGIPTPSNELGDVRRAAFDSEAANSVVQQSATKHGLSSLDRTLPLTGVGIPTPTDEPTFWLCADCLDFHISVEPPTFCTRCDCVRSWEIVPTRIWQNAQALKSWWKERHQAHREARHLAQLATSDTSVAPLNKNAEVVAGLLKAQVNSLSLSNARKLVNQFGTHLVEKALAKMQSRNHLRNPAGFVIAFLRSEYKLYNNNKNSTKPVQKPKGESAIEWLQRLAQSEYLSFIENADDILKSVGVENYALSKA